MRKNEDGGKTLNEKWEKRENGRNDQSKMQNQKEFHRLLAVLILLVLIVSQNSDHDVLAQIGSGDNVDRLAYVVANDISGATLMVYDPHSGISTSILSDSGMLPFSFSADGRLAFESEQEDNSEVYVLDTLVADDDPINISQSPTTRDFPLAWSPDGQYLAFGSYDTDRRLQIYVWDGKTALNITPDDLIDDKRAYIDYHISSAVWSFDGRLAFTLRSNFDAPPEVDLSEIYLWDGLTTTSLSQNPKGEDISPVWSADGRLAFQSEQSDEYDIFVWDGVSVINGSPNKNTFANISPELTAYYSFPRWTSNGFLAFESAGLHGSYAQIYVWDGYTATNLSQNPNLHNSGATWSTDGRWAFVTFFSSEQMVYVRDADNHTLLAVEGQYGPAWSLGGFLAFCQSHWVLAVWNGLEVIEVAEGPEIHAEWQGGRGVSCSSG